MGVSSLLIRQKGTCDPREKLLITEKKNRYTGSEEQMLHLMLKINKTYDFLKDLNILVKEILNLL